ncbi:MAG TPA: MBL fold metallo-hydrolase [Candidatus Paceibacterota bacterium]
MIITALGKHFVKLQVGDFTVAVNPPILATDPKASRFKADVVLCSSFHPSVHGVDTVTYGGSEPFVIDAAGEYEVGNLWVRGFQTNVTDQSGYSNIIYFLKLDDMNVVISGSLESLESISVEAREEIDTTNIAIVSLGEPGGMNSHDVYKFAHSLSPNIIIPVGMFEKEDMTLFLKEAGAKDVSPLEKLTVKRKDIEGKEAEVVLLEM